MSKGELRVSDPIMEEKSCWEPGGSTHVEFKFKFRAPEGGMVVKLS